MSLNMFQIRTRGGLHDHPAPLNAIYRIRMIILGKNPGVVQKNTNVQGEQDEEFLLSSALNKAGIKATINIQELSNPEESDTDKFSETSSTSSSMSASLNKICEKDGLVYIAGFLARKHHKEFPELGSYTYENEAKNMHSYAMPSWVQSLSFGGLTEPSLSWKENVEKMDKWFIKLHRNNFKFKTNIVKRTSHFIFRKVSNILYKLVYSFVKQRVFIRIKYINTKKDETSSVKRKRDDPETDESRKRAKNCNIRFFLTDFLTIIIILQLRFCHLLFPFLFP